MTNIKIQAVSEQDLTHILSMIQDLAEYEQEPEAVSVDLATLTKDFQAGFFQAKLAVVDEEIAGMILYHTAYSTWKGRVLYLEDFYIKEQFRRHKIGSALFDAFIAEGKEIGAQQLRWQVLDWNAQAIHFYKKHQAVVESGWLNGRIYYN